MKTNNMENLYMQEAKEYELTKNKDFLNWLKNSISDGYKIFIGLEDLQNLIDKIVKFYEDSYLMGEDNFLNRDISDLLNSLKVKEQDFLKGVYRTGMHIQSYNYDDGAFKRIEHIYLKVNKKNVYYPYSDEMQKVTLCANFNTGEILNNTAKDYVNGDITLEELLKIFNEKYQNELDFTELKECVYNNYCDIELRHRLLEMVALKIAFSGKTSPEEGYEIAKSFIDDFNEKFGLTLSTEKLDFFFKKNYLK